MYVTQAPYCPTLVMVTIPVLTTREQLNGVLVMIQIIPAIITWDPSNPVRVIMLLKRATKTTPALEVVLAVNQTTHVTIT